MLTDELSIFQTGKPKEEAFRSKGKPITLWTDDLNRFQESLFQFLQENSSNSSTNNTRILILLLKHNNS